MFSSVVKKGKCLLPNTIVFVRISKGATKCIIHVGIVNEIKINNGIFTNKLMYKIFEFKPGGSNKMFSKEFHILF